LCPLYLVVLGANVAKLGVPGRPAGGIDVLAQVEGYKTQLSAFEIYSAIEKCGYTHFNAGVFAPLDAEIFRYRQETGAQNVPDLVIASLLSKKLCVGVNRIGLDVRVSPFGNFGTTWDEAQLNASKFCKVASFLGKKAKCFLTNGSIPYQPYIGRSEALFALNEVFNANMDEALREHDQLCFTMANELMGASYSPKPAVLNLQKVFFENLESQNGLIESYFRTVDMVSKSHSCEIVSMGEGFLEIDLHMVRSIMVGVQRINTNEENIFPDPCGIILKSKVGQKVKKGSLLATLRCNKNDEQDLIEKFGKAFRVRETIVNDIDRFEVVNNV